FFRYKHEIRYTQLSEHFLYGSLESKEILFFSVKSYGHGVALGRKIFIIQQVHHKGVAYLKSSDRSDIARIIASQNFEQTRHEYGPHNGSVFSQRIDYLYEASFP